MISVDALNGDFSFIKADVEGSEVQTINGAENTISRCRPKMQIACYHRTGDLTDIPQAVCNIRNDYRIYMAAFPGSACMGYKLLFRIIFKIKRI